MLTPEIAEVLAAPEYRVEGNLKVTGRARYAGDAWLPGTLWAKFLTSPVSHARIVSIDVEAARVVPGVHAVLTGADVRPARFGRRYMDWPVLAWDRVRFIGDRVAAVAAETREAAEEALRLIEVEYEELPAVFEPADALRDAAPLVHEDTADYVLIGGKRAAMPHPNLQGRVLVQKGEADLEPLFANAFRVFEDSYYTPRHHHGYIEPHACLVWFDEEGVLHVISTNKAPFALRQQLAIVSGLAPEQIEVDSRFIGGDFGGKGLSIDEFACFFLARATGRPIKAVMTYVDELQGTNPRHAATIRLRTAVDQDGRFIAHQADVHFNGGAYAAGKPTPELTPQSGVASMAAYNVPNTRLDLKTAYTNTVPAGHMRAPGEVQALFAGECHVDRIAQEMGLDPIELRMRNALRSGDTGPANERFREMRAVEVLERAREEIASRPALPPNRGRGIALGVRHIGAGKTGLAFRLDADGTIEVLTGVPDQGSGSHTLIRRVAAAVLSVKPERIAVRFGTTAEALNDPGAGASRVTHIVGEAARLGATQLKEQLEELAAEVMGWPAGQVRLERDRFVLTDGSGEGAPFAEVAERLARGSTVETQSSYDGEHPAEEPADFNFHVFVVEVEVDPDSGRVRVCDAMLVVDVGPIINPVAHQGQIEGGFIYGIGGALMEELVVEDGKVTTLSLGEYKLPTQRDAPPFRAVFLPTTVGPGPFGAKMAGEVSNSGVAPAIANAIFDAVGIRVKSLPISAERVLEALRSQDGASAQTSPTAR